MDSKSNYLTQKYKLKQQEDISLDFSSWPSLESWVSERGHWNKNTLALLVGTSIPDNYETALGQFLCIFVYTWAYIPKKCSHKVVLRVWV